MLCRHFGLGDRKNISTAPFASYFHDLYNEVSQSRGKFIVLDSSLTNRIWGGRRTLKLCQKFLEITSHAKLRLITLSRLNVKVDCGRG